MHRFLTSAQVKRLHARIIAKVQPTQLAMLEFALGSPFHHSCYGQTDVFQLAGVPAAKVALNHAYQDGNKRTALFAADMLLKMNGALST